jgi:hypothetical protein
METTPLSCNRPDAAKEIARIATVWVTSEAADACFDQVFDQRQGLRRSRWVAAQPGEQPLILAFDTSETIRTISQEVEELEVSRTRVLHVSVSRDRGQIYPELWRQEYTCSPPGTTFEQEDWVVTINGVTPSNR